MKLYYLYVRDPRIAAAHAMTDGHFALIDYMVENGIVDEADAILDIYRAQEEQRVITKPGVVIRRRNGIADLKPAVGDVVWIRGGWKAWLPWINECMEKKIWLIYYDANTSHASWKYWDVVLSDIIREQGFGKQKNLWYWYPKPVSPVFHPYDVPTKFDICIGGSKVHDKKGQWRVYKAVVEYERLFGERLRCVMPGCYYYGTANTRAMQAEIQTRHNVTELPLLPRPELAKIFSMSKIVTHTCGGGYGDRAPLEAGACGCPIVLAQTKRHAPFVFSGPELVWVPEDVDNSVEFAKGLKQWIAAATPEKRQKVAAHFRNHASISTGSGPRMKRLFEFFRAHPQADRHALKDVELEEIPT